jgi:hypothetical protein
LFFSKVEHVLSSKDNLKVTFLPFREHSVAFMEHSVAFREHSVALKKHSVGFREHSVAFREPSVTIREHQRCACPRDIRILKLRHPHTRTQDIRAPGLGHPRTRTQTPAHPTQTPAHLTQTSAHLTQTPAHPDTHTAYTRRLDTDFRILYSDTRTLSLGHPHTRLKTPAHLT